MGILDQLFGSGEGSMVAAWSNIGTEHTYTLSAPHGTLQQGKLTVAIRPEDFAFSSPPEPGMWTGAIEQVIDLGHYRKAHLTVAGLGILKVYLPKSRDFQEGEALGIKPIRYLVYPVSGSPLEVQLSIRSG